MGRHGRFENFRIGPSLSNRIESNRIGTADSNSNRISKLRRSLLDTPSCPIAVSSLSHDRLQSREHGNIVASSADCSRRCDEVAAPLYGRSRSTDALSHLNYNVARIMGRSHMRFALLGCAGKTLCVFSIAQLSSAQRMCERPPRLS